jgi:hypothetical protein
LRPNSVQVDLNVYDSLPEIQQELEKSILNARVMLSSLPKEPSKDPRNEISNLLHGFVTHLARHMEGVPDEDGLIQSIRPAQEKFKLAIRRTAPEFRPFEKRFAGTKIFHRATFLRNEEGGVSDVDDVDPSLEPKGKTKMTGQKHKIYIDEVLQRAHQ